MKRFALPLGIFLLAFTIRMLYASPHNITLGFDQIRDLSTARAIIEQGDIKIIGPTAGNNQALHHGVLYWYLIAPLLVLFGGNPIGAVFTIAVFNALSCVVLYFFAWRFFGTRRHGIVAALLCAFSFQYIQYSGWLSNPTPTLFTVPLFFWGLWEFLQKKQWGWIVMSIAFGLTIQFELFFLYLIPLTVLVFLLFRPTLPSRKTIVVSFLIVSILLSTMIATEAKYHFEGIKSILGSGQNVGGALPFGARITQYMRDTRDVMWLLSPAWPAFEKVIWTALVGFFVVKLMHPKTNKGQKKQVLFLLLYFFSPAIMLLLGFHNAPWFGIGRPGAIILLATGILCSVKKNTLLIPLMLLIFVQSGVVLMQTYGHGQTLLEPDESSLLATQLQVIDYTYEKANNKPFSINTVTNPLYINVPWAYHYAWYGKQKGYLPSWIGGDQSAPFNTLKKATGNEAYLFVIMDTTPRIPDSYRKEALFSAAQFGTAQDDAQFLGIDVQTYAHEDK